MREKVFEEHKTSKCNQMIYINSLSSIVSAATLLLTGSLGPAVTFFAHPRFV